MNKFLFGFMVAAGCFFAAQFYLNNSTAIHYTTLKIDQLDKCIKDLQLPCRWATHGTWYGSAAYNYLGPLPYYLGWLLLNIRHNLSFVAKIILSLPLLLGFIFGYLLLQKKITTKIQSLSFGIIISTFFFIMVTFLPYSLGLGWFLSFLPGLFFCLKSLKIYPNTFRMLLLSLVIGLLILSSREGLFLTVIFLVALVLVNGIKNNTCLVSKTIFSLLLGLNLTAFYWIPAIFEINLIHLATKNGDFLPVYASTWPERPVVGRIQVLTGDTTVSNYKEGSNWITFEANSQNHSIVRLALYHFPNWVITVNGQAVHNYYHNNSWGLSTILLGKGNHTVEARLNDTPIRSIANFISAAGGLLFLFLLLIERRRIRKLVFYYFNAMGR